MCPSQDVATAVIGAARAHGRRTLLGSGWAGLSPIDDRADCLAVDEINHEALFKQVATVVHHGGAGTTMTAARAGVSQVVVPQVGDQHYWARRVTGLGIGAAVDDPAPTAESLSAALGIALSAATRTRAGALASAIRTDGAAVAARTLLDTVRAKGRRRLFGPSFPRSWPDFRRIFAER
jgi:vancomycin aglycone glucosyltransferase